MKLKLDTMVPFKDLENYLKTGKRPSYFPELKGYSIENVISDSREYYQIILERSKKHILDVKTAKLIVDKIETLVPIVSKMETEIQYQFLLVVYYFIQVEDFENDLNSPIGFDDDSEIVNLFLERIQSDLPRIML